MKKAKTKPHAAIVIIGNEILSGRTQDVNVTFLSGNQVNFPKAYPVTLICFSAFS